MKPTCSVVSPFKRDEVTASIPMPDVFSAPIRFDVVNTMHHFLKMSRRQAIGRKYNAGGEHSAISWGTGRAVSRIPRISGSGTRRSGQGAFGNMCRKGRMFAPLKTWRVWVRRVSQRQKRMAQAAAIAASAHVPLVIARGHKVDRIRELPLVLDNKVESVQKTKEAMKIVKEQRLIDDVNRCRAGKHIRAGKAHMRNRKYHVPKGPLIIYKNDNGIVHAFRNILGVELCSVDKLNLLKLAPGGKIGRLIVWTENAFKSLNERFGSYDAKRTQSVFKTRSGDFYKLPRPMLKNTDISRIIKSDAIQAVVRPAIKKPKKTVQMMTRRFKRDALRKVEKRVIKAKNTDKKSKKVEALNAKIAQLEKKLIVA